MSNAGLDGELRVVNFPMFNTSVRTALFMAGNAERFSTPGLTTLPEIGSKALERFTALALLNMRRDGVRANDRRQLFLGLMCGASGLTNPLLRQPNLTNLLNEIEPSSLSKAFDFILPKLEDKSTVSDSEMGYPVITRAGKGIIDDSLEQHLEDEYSKIGVGVIALGHTLKEYIENLNM